MGKMTFDSALVQISPNRTIDPKSGYMRVTDCNISKEQVRDYYGSEIPQWEELGLNPDMSYGVLCPGDELEKAAPTFDGIPVLFGHHVYTVENAPEDKECGNLYGNVYYEAPYLKSNLLIKKDYAIECVVSDECKELSSGYTYTPVLEKGVFDGKPYSLKMTNINGNHVAVVPDGRAGSDVVVNDAKPTKGKIMNQLEALVKALKEVLGGRTDEKREDTYEELTDDRHDRDTVRDAEYEEELEKLLYVFLDEGQDKTTADRVKELVEALSRINGQSAEDAVCDETEERREDWKEDRKRAERREEDRLEDRRERRLANDTDIDDIGKDDDRFKKIPEYALDAAMVKKIVHDEQQKARMEAKALLEAVELVAPICGRLDALAFDSAMDIYKEGFKALNVDIKNRSKEECKGYLAGVAGSRMDAMTKDWNVTMAMDEKIDKDSGLGRLLATPSDHRG